MHERLVLCGGAERKGRQPTEKLRLSLTSSQSNINLRLQDISRRMVANVSDLLTDLVRTPDHWSSWASDALTDVLTFLSDDEFSFEFTKQARLPSSQTYLIWRMKGRSGGV